MKFFKGENKMRQLKFKPFFRKDEAGTNRVDDYIRYIHHGTWVWVREDLKGKHREHCLCHSCKYFQLNTHWNCPIAQANYENCVKYSIVTPVWECPNFHL